MKKLILIIVTILFGGSIALVGVLGAQLDNPPDKVINKVKSLDFDLEKMVNQDGVTYERVYENEVQDTVCFVSRNKVESYVQIEFKFNPEDATIKDLDLIIVDIDYATTTIDTDPKSNTFARLNFSQPLGTDTRTSLIFKTRDGTNISKSIILHVK